MLRISKTPSKGRFFDGALMVFFWGRGGIMERGDYLVGDLEEPPTMSVFWMVVLVFFTWALSEPKR